MNRVVYILFMLLALGCKKENTVWETEWGAPLINDTLSLDNWVNDSTFTQSGNNYVLDLERTLFDLKLNELISLPDTTIQELFIPAVSISVAPGTSFAGNTIEEHVFEIEEVQLKKVILSGGYIDFKISNPLATKTFFNVSLPGVEKDGIEFLGQYEAPAAYNGVSGQSQNTLDLTGYELDLTGITGGEFNILQSYITVTSDPFGPTVTLTPQDITIVDVTLREITIDYARGYFGNKIISDTSDVTIELLNSINSGAIDFPAASISFEVENGIKVSAEGLLTTVRNENALGVVVNLSSPQIGSSFNIDPAIGSWNTLTPSHKEIVFDQTNSNIETFMENLGAKNELGYKIQLNPWGNVSGGWDEMFPNSTFKIRMKANMPLSIGLDGLVLSDKFDVSFNQEPGKTRIKSGEFILETSNAFPISAAIKLILLDQNGTALHTIAGTEAMQAAQFGQFSTEHNLYVADSKLHFVLSEAVLNDLNSVKRIVVEATFNTLNPTNNMSEQMSIPFGAFLAVKLKAKLKSENVF